MNSEEEKKKIIFDKYDCIFLYICNFSKKIKRITSYIHRFSLNIYIFNLLILKILIS